MIFLYLIGSALVLAAQSRLWNDGLHGIQGGRSC